MQEKCERKNQINRTMLMKGKGNARRVAQRKEIVIYIRIWNLVGIYGEGVVKNLIEKRSKYRTEIVILQETHLKDIGEQEVDRHILFKS